MEKTKKRKFEPHICETCTQTTEYVIRLDKGSAHIVMALAEAVRRCDRNRIHLKNDMLTTHPEELGGYNNMVAAGFMTSWMIGNVLRPKYFGLVAQVDGGGQGEYLLTPKGARFLRGDPVEAVAVIDKKTHSKKRYLEEEGTVTIFDLLKRDQKGTTPYWNLQDLFDRNDYAKRLVEEGATASLFAPV